jgi:hypothetical protein
MPSRPTGFTVATAAIVATAILALAGCSGNTPAPLPSAQSMTVAAYERVLTGIDKGLGSDFQRLRSARIPSAVSAAAAATEADVSRDLNLLVGVSPPGRFEAGNAAIIPALMSFYAALGSAASAASTGQVCAGTSATALISRSAGTAQLRSAEARLSAADPAHLAHLGSFLPPVTADANRRLDNGTLIKKASPGGLGEVKVDNSEGSADAVVSLVSGNEVTEMAVYVRARSSATVHGIHDGEYQVYVTNGDDWETPANLFTRNCEFGKFNRAADFTTKISDDTTGYTFYEIDLNPSVYGNATESKVPPAQYPSP